MGDGNVKTTADIMKSQADLYYTAAGIVIEHSEKIRQKVILSKFQVKLSDEEKKTAFLSLPAHCLYAFSVELYLKSLNLLKNEDYKRTHYYDELFETLSESIRKEIENEYNKVFDDNLLEKLKKHRDDFQSIRYAGECKGGVKQLSFVKWFCEVVRTIAEKHIKD